MHEETDKSSKEQLLILFSILCIFSVLVGIEKPTIIDVMIGIFFVSRIIMGDRNTIKGLKRVLGALIFSMMFDFSWIIVVGGNYLESSRSRDQGALIISRYVTFIGGILLFVFKGLIIIFLCVRIQEQNKF